FNNKISSPDATVYFPASGYRDYNVGSLYDVGYYVFYWSAVPNNSNNGCSLYFGSGFVYPRFNYHGSVGFSVRPVADE
ncbi:MAG: hypothetical protein ACTTK2_08405, partial [Hoylesella marshii]|uniref:hypothetical protein n=1 Tax=Hoylesella marshii TaxID=189722 RepID=UPI003F9F7117